MDLSEFTRALERLSGNDIHAVAAGLVAFTQSAADEVAAWNAILTVDRELRRCRRTREAAAASCRAARSVQIAAQQAHIPLPDDDVTRVARAAGDIARAFLVHDQITPGVTSFLQSWELLFFPGRRLRPAFHSAA